MIQKNQKKIIEYVSKIEIEHESLLLGMRYTTYPRYETTLYKTKKGNYFKHIGKCIEKDVSYKDYDYIKIVSESEVKKILNDLNEVKIYKKYFNDLEEG